jgi:hypothetical protein
MPDDVDLSALRSVMLTIPVPQCVLIWRAYVQLTVRSSVFERYIEASRAMLSDH